MKCIKRMAAFCMAAVLALSMSVGAFAAESPSVSGIISGARARFANGRTAEVTLTEVTDDSVKAELQNEDFLKQVIGSEYAEGMTLADLKSVTLPEDAEFPVTFELNVNGVKAGSKAVILYFDGTEWKKATVESVADGLITVTFETEPTMIALVMDKSEVAAANIGTTSPKTGMSPIVMMAALGAVVCMAGAVVLAKKERA